VSVAPGDAVIAHPLGACAVWLDHVTVAAGELGPVPTLFVAVTE
jgi:hypothetical protein